MSDLVTELRNTYRHHTDIAAAIADTLYIIERSPIARLRVACHHYDTGHDPDAIELAAALAAACRGLEVE